jgi:transcription factor SPN1
MQKKMKKVQHEQIIIQLQKSNRKIYIRFFQSNFDFFSNIVYDIDLYLEKKAERRRGNRRRGGKNGDVDLAGPDADQFVSQLISQMKVATEEDRIFNKKRQPATAKLLLLPVVEHHLYRADLTEIFLDNGVLNVFKVR